MAEIVGVRFKIAGRVYYFDPAGFDLEVNDYVVVNTARGLELGQVVTSPEQVSVGEVARPLKPVVRKAEPEDIKRAQEFEDREREALAECGKLITKLNLPMKLLSAEYNLDGSRLTFFFSAAERVDFRELVRELSKHFKLRVELRQVGSRDESKLIGGFGRCGRPLCCLLCCLGYEGEQYRVMKAKLPKEGQRVSVPMGIAKVVGGNPLKETVLVELESRARVELPLSEVTIIDH